MRQAVPTLIFVVAAILMLPARSAAVLAQWKEPLEQADALVKAGEYEKAEALSRKVANEIADTAGAGNLVAETLGIAVTLRALATVGVGDIEYGVWLWHTALNINPGLLDLDLGPYKGPGALLAKHPLFHPDLTEWDPDARITRPKVKKRQNIRFPRGSSAFRNAGALVFESFVDETGQISLPIVDDRPPASTLIYTALEGVWRWKIEPAKADGKPVPCYYRLTVSYKPQRR